jgi:hypothetical protein
MVAGLVSLAKVSGERFKRSLGLIEPFAQPIQPKTLQVGVSHYNVRATIGMYGRISLWRRFIGGT